jgi:hypothetical protein
VSATPFKLRFVTLPMNYVQFASSAQTYSNITRNTEVYTERKEIFLFNLHIKGTDHSENTDVEEKIILEWILENWV